MTTIKYDEKATGAIICDECKMSVQVVISFGVIVVCDDRVDVEVYVCKDCLQKALDLLAGSPK